MPRVGFEPTISGGERPKTYALDRAATGTGTILYYVPLSAFPPEYIPRYIAHTFCLIVPHQCYFLSKLGSLGSHSLNILWNKAYNE